MQHLLVSFYWLYPCIMLFHVHILSFCEGLFLCSKGNNCGNCKDRLEKNVVQLSCSKHGKLNSLQFKKEKVLVYTLLGRHHTLQLHFTNMAAWSLSKCLTHWHPKHVFFFFVSLPSAYFCHIVKLLIKKETTRSFPTVFFLLSLPVSVGLITTNYNQQPLSSLLKSKRQAFILSPMVQPPLQR